jgi:hypothetical protein
MFQNLSYENSSSAFFYFGILSFSCFALKLAYRILVNIGTFYLDLGAINFKKYGSWVIVTGCTDGIGKFSYLDVLRSESKTQN